MTVVLQLLRAIVDFPAAGRARHADNVGTAERLASAVGGLLAWYGLRRRSPAGYAMAAISRTSMSSKS